MSVKVKTILLTAVTLLVMGAGIFLLSRDFLLGQFMRVEEIIQNNDIGRISKSVDRVYTELGSLAVDWANRDEVDQYIKGNNPRFLLTDISPSVYESLEIDLIALADQQGNLHYSQYYDRETRELVNTEAAFTQLFQPGGVFYGLDGKVNPPNTLIRMAGKPYLATARTIRPIPGDGSSSGVVVMARQVDGQLLDFLRVDTGITGMDFYFIENAPDDYVNIQPQIPAGQSTFLHIVSPDIIHGYVNLTGADGATDGVLDSILPRSITREGQIAILYLLYGMLGIAATAMLINLAISNFLLFRPLEQLALRVKQANNLQEQIQTLVDRPSELQTIGEPLAVVLQRAQQTEQESLNRQILYTRLFEQAHEGFAILDSANLAILDANQEFISMLHWDRASEPQISFHTLVEKWLDEETANRLLMIERDVAQGTARLREQEVNLRGLNKEIEISFSPIQVAQTRYLYALLRDVSERKQLERTLQEQSRETTLLNQVIAVTTSDLEPTAVFETVCRELAINLGLPQSSLAIFNEERTHLEIVAEYSTRSMPSAVGVIIPIEENNVFESSETLVEPFQVDIQHAADIVPELRDLFEKRGVESALLVPLAVRERIIGWLALEDILAHRFDAEELRLAQHMALAASRAYEVTALYHDLQDELAKRQVAEEALDKRKRHLEALVNMLMELLSLEGSARLYEQVLPALGEITQIDRVTVFELFTSADGRPYLRQMAGWEPGETPYAPISESLRVEGELAELFRNLQVGQYVAGRLAELPASLGAFLKAQGVKSTLILPFYAKEELAGFIGFDALESEREWDALEVALLQAAGASISLTRQRIEAGEALRDSEGRYRLVVENARDVIFQIDLTGRFTFLNPAWETITGLKVEDTLGLPFWKSAPESMVQELGAGFRILRERVTDRYHQTITIKNLNGKTIWLDAFFRIVADASGTGQLIAGTLVDITSYKRIEYILRRNEEALRSLYDITSSLSLAFEKKLNNLLMMGAQTFELDYGFLGKVNGEQLSVVYSYPEYDAQDTTNLDMGLTFTRETMRANEPLGIENVPASDWANHPAAVKGNVLAYLGTPVMVGKDVFGVLAFYNQKPRGSAFSLADKEFMRLMAQWIGSEYERERYTEQLKSYNEEIASKSFELAEARDEALEASRLKSEFLATMSHEIRTPLNAVIGMAELLMETPLNDEQNDFARIIRESGRSLLTIINDILDFSKIEAGRMALEAVDFELMSLIDGVMDMFSQPVQKKGIGLHSFISAEVPLVLVGDPVRLRQILTNLVGNGVKFTDIGEVIVRIDLVKLDGDQADLLIKVSDSGIGLSDVANKRLFSPFTQADGSTTRKYGGTGLGLVITKRLVELMDGEIGVKSVEGIGSTFWIRLPLKVNLAELAASKQSLPDLSTKNVLVLDGNPAQRRLLGSFLNSWGGIHVDLTWDTTTAEELLSRSFGNGQNPAQAYNLVICDLSSPNIDAQRIRDAVLNYPEIAKPGFVYLAGYDQRELAEALVENGHGAYLTKPIRQSALFDLIVDYFEKGEAGLVQERPAAVVFDEQESLSPITYSQPSGTNLILLAEDNPANQRLAMVQLKRLGYQTELVSNGVQAIEAYLNAPGAYNLVLMDCQMPIMDGFDATRRIREEEKRLNLHVPIVAMTANAMQGDREACLIAGMDDYVSKPVSLESLRQVLNRIQDGKAASVEVNLPAAVMDDYNPLDQSVLDGLRELQEEGEPDFLTELIDIFLEDSASLVQELNDAVNAQDLSRVRMAAHTLKGSSGNLGANLFSKICYEMELSARNDDLSGAEKILPTLTREYDMVHEFLSRERKVEN